MKVLRQYCWHMGTNGGYVVEYRVRDFALILCETLENLLVAEPFKEENRIIFWADIGQCSGIMPQVTRRVWPLKNFLHVHVNADARPTTYLQATVLILNLFIRNIKAERGVR